MTTDHIRYDLLVQEALKGVVRRILTDAARDGLPGEHHFYISFKTDAPGVRLSPRLRERYPRDMTIVLQHQYDALTVGENAFEVGLSFSGVPERLRVPYAALTGFFDPSVQFGLKFEAAVGGAAGEGEANVATLPPPDTPASVGGVPKIGGRKLAAVEEPRDRPARRPGAKKADKPAGVEGPKTDSDAGGTAEVVSLDAFRKKS